MAFKLLLLFISSCLFAEVGYTLPWGKGVEINRRQEKKHSLSKGFDPLSIVAENVILFHQQILSPIDGPRSHFRPTSSQYMLLAIHRHGFLMGTLKGFDRLMRENNDSWVYRTKTIEGKKYKWDPTY